MLNGRLHSSSDRRARGPLFWLASALIATSACAMASASQVICAENDGGRLLIDCVPLLDTPQPYGVLVEPESGYLYWSTTDTTHLAIRRRPLSGGDTTEVTALTQQFGGLAHMAIDVEHSWIYFVYSTDPADAIYRADLVGSAPTLIVSAAAGGLQTPRGIAVNPAAGRIYWSDTGGGTIKRANLDGSDVSTLIGGLPGPVGLALDPAGATLYWVDSVADRIESIATDGSGHAIIKDTGLVNPHSLALDAQSGRLYWSDFGTGTVGSCRLDGSDSTIECTSSGGLRGVAVVPPPPCDADFNRTGAVDGADLSILLGYWGTTGTGGVDLDASGDVDGGDIAIFLGAWGPCPA